ncbi:PHD finger protein 7, partial [Apaloderma vittatum]
CVLCHRAVADPTICGDMWEKRGLRAHIFCLYFATELPRLWDEEAECMAVRRRDVRLVAKRAAQKGCDRSFHLPCAVKGQCVTQYLPQHRAFCDKHSPRQAVE